MMKEILKIRTHTREYSIPAGKPVIIQWRSTNKTRKGVSTAIGWIKPSDDPRAIVLIHSAFQTWDHIEQEYPSKWKVWNSQIIDIRPLKAMRFENGN